MSEMDDRLLVPSHNDLTEIPQGDSASPPAVPSAPLPRSVNRAWIIRGLIPLTFNTTARIFLFLHGDRLEFRAGGCLMAE
jgi:hypothetical protein